MTEMFTIQLSVETARRVKETANRTGQPIDAILSAWIERDSLAAEFSPLKPGVEYPIYTPLGNEAAAAVLMQVLKEAEETDKKQDRSASAFTGGASSAQFG